jgi:hypothetical protein
MLFMRSSSRSPHYRFITALALLSGLGCSPAADADPGYEEAAPARGAGGSSGGGAALAPQISAPGVVPTTSSPGATPSSANACPTTRAAAELIKEPVDIVVILDNSLSMVDEARSVESNLNANFAAILRDAAIDYRVIIISEHRTNAFPLATSVCIGSPLSGLAQCPGAQPSFTDRFFHYSTEIGSNDSFDVLLQTYHGERRDEYGLAPAGWSAWLRQGAKKVFLAISDDNAERPVSSFLSALTTLAPEHFGTDALNPTLVWHSIIGLAEKPNPVEAYLPGEPVQLAPCFGNANLVFNAGPGYQDLSIQTGGLRFPICQFSAYDTVFKAIADSVVQSSGITCSFPLPPPPNGQRLELDKVAVSYSPGDGSASRVLGQVTSPDACQADAFVATAEGIALCPQACDVVRGDTAATVDVLFTCASTLIVR